MLIRLEEPGDERAIRAVHAAAFAGPEKQDASGTPIEARLVDDLRAGPSWIPELSLIAESDDGTIVGHIVCSRATLEPGGHRVLGLGPLGVLPEQQRQGVGSELVRATIAAAEELGEPLIALLGNPDYYSRFGFLLSYNHGVQPPNPQWTKHFQTRPLPAYHAELRGTFHYDKAFPTE